MSLSELCIRRPVFTILLMASLLVAGIAGYRSLPVSALPRVDFPTIQVNANLSGASPETMASSVVTPLERQFSTIAGLSSMTSTSFLGYAQITLQFDLERNIDGAALDVQTAISTTIPRLPKEMISPPSFQKVNPADQPIFFVAVSSDTLPLSQVNEFAETMMAQRISTITGVAQVMVYGSQKHAVRVQVDPSKLAAKGMDLGQVRKSLAEASSNSPVGAISGVKQFFNLKIAGQPQDAAGFREIIATWKDGAPVRMREIATVIDGVENDRSIGFLNNKQAIVLAIQRQPDANTIEVVEKVRALLPVFRTQIPASVELTPMLDRSVAIREALHDVQITMLLTIALVVAVIFLFLRSGRATLIPALAVPLSIIATYGGMSLLGYSINNVSLLALTLCVGFVVDDAIVVLENITRHIEEGMKPFEAAIKGVKEVGFTIISMTISLVAVFIPVLFMGGIIGRLFREFAVTISMAILISGFVSLTLTPMLCARFLKPKSPHPLREGVGGGVTQVDNSQFMSPPTPSFPHPFFSKERGGGGHSGGNWFDWLLGKYENSLKLALRHRFAMLMLTFATLAASLWAFYAVPKGFFPLEDTGFVFARSEAVQDISYSAMVEKQKQAVEILKKDPAVENVFNAVGGNRGTMNSGLIFFGLKPRAERPPVFVVIQRLRSSLQKLEGLNVYMQPVQNMQIGGRPSKAMYQYTFQGTELEQLYKSAEDLTQSLAKEKIFQDVSSDLQLKSLQALLRVNQDKAASLGISYDNIRQALYNAYGSAQAGSIYTSANDYAIIIEVAPEFQQSPDDISKIYVQGSQNLVPLTAFATVERELGPLSVNHQGQLPAVTISFNLSPNIALGEAVQKLHDLEQQLKVPDNIMGSFQGAAQAFKDSAQGNGILLLFAVLVVYIILGMLYESFIHPITILSGLPSAGLGAVLMLMIFKTELSVIAIVGVILLVGIVKKNSIMMIDFALQARKEGASAETAIYEACITRFRPIMMTTMAAILGTLPIALGLGAGSELRQPLGIAVVGGLLTSQLLTLYITPVVYLYLDKLRGK